MIRPKSAILRSWWVGLLVLGIVLTGCAPSSATITTSTGHAPLSDGTITGTVFIGRAKPLAVPSASVTIQSQDGLTRTTKASPDGTFAIQVPAQKWKVVRVTPPGFDRFCAIPTTIHVVAHHTTTVRVQVACTSSSGGGYLR